VSFINNKSRLAYRTKKYLTQVIKSKQFYLNLFDLLVVTEYNFTNSECCGMEIIILVCTYGIFVFKDNKRKLKESYALPDSY